MTTDRPVLVFLLRPVLAVYRIVRERRQERRWLDSPVGCCYCGAVGAEDDPPVTRFLYVGDCGPDWAACSAHPLPGRSPAVDYGRNVPVTCRQAEADIARALRDGPDIIDPGSVSLGLLGAVLAVLVAVAVVAAGPPPALGVMAVLGAVASVAAGVVCHILDVEADRRDALIDIIHGKEMRIDDLERELGQRQDELAALGSDLTGWTDALRVERDEARAENARLRGEHASDDGEDTGAEPPARRTYRLIYAYRDQDGTTGQQDLYVDLTQTELTALSGILAETTDRADGVITLPGATTPGGTRDIVVLRVRRIISLNALGDGEAAR